MPSAGPSPGHAPSTHWRTPGPGLLALVAVVTAFAVFGHEGWRVIQMAILALPLLAWSAWPLSSAWALRVRRITVWIWALAFVADGAVRAYLLSAYPRGSGPARRAP